MTDLHKLRVQDYLEHMQEAVRLAQSYAVGMSKEDFLKDRRTQQAVVLNLITLGEVAARLMSEHSEFADAHPDIPWRQMRGMRNRPRLLRCEPRDCLGDVQKSLPELERQLGEAKHSSG